MTYFILTTLFFNSGFFLLLAWFATYDVEKGIKEAGMACAVSIILGAMSVVSFILLLMVDYHV